MDGLHVNVLNPRKGTGKKKGAGKTMASKRPRNKKGQFKKGGKGGGSKKGRTSNPSKGGGGGGSKKKKPRRSNPNSNGATAMSIGHGMKNFWPKFLGKLWVVWVVRRFGNLAGQAGGINWGTGSLIPGAGQTYSPFRGRSWTMANYAVGYFGLKIMANMLLKNRGAAWAHAFFHSGFDSLVSRLVWTEAFARSPWLQQQFGQPAGQAAGQVAGQVVRDPQTGQTRMFYDGRWQDLQGAAGQIVHADAMMGAADFGQLIHATPLDGGDMGQPVHADALMGNTHPGDAAARAAYAQNPEGVADPYSRDYMGTADPYASMYSN